MIALWQEVRLIKAVAARRCLWDSSHPDYHDTRTLWPKNWLEIAEELNAHGSNFTGNIILTK